MDELIKFETAKLAFSKGFMISQHYAFTHKGESLYDHEHCYAIDGVYFRPTQTTLQKWLREEHNTHVTVVDYESTQLKKVMYKIHNGTAPNSDNIESLLSRGIDPTYIGLYESYEIAMEFGLCYALSHLKI